MHRAAQDKKPRGLIPLVPSHFTSAKQNLSDADLKGQDFKSGLAINLKQADDAEAVMTTYLISDNNPEEVDGAHALTVAYDAQRSDTPHR